jgi:hypothetical protein
MRWAAILFGLLVLAVVVAVLFSALVLRLI